MSKRITLDIGSKSVMVNDRRVQVLGDISCSIAAGSFVLSSDQVVAATTFLSGAIMGLDLDFAGEIEIGDQAVQGPGVDRGMVFPGTATAALGQDTRENIAFVQFQLARNPSIRPATSSA